MNNKIVVVVSILLVLSLLVYAFYQKQQADALGSIVINSQQELIECKKNNEELLQYAEAQRALAEDMQRVADFERMQAYEQLKLAESKLK